MLEHVDVSWDAVSAVGQASGSLISAGSLVVAAVTLRREGRRWREERTAEAEDRREAERALASLVSATTYSSGSYRAHVLVVNDGERPVFHVRVTSARGAPLRARSDERSLGDTIRRLESRESVRLEFETLPGEEDFSRPVLRFVDIFGHRWSRAGLSRPERADV
jgi:hypothetical protein